MTGAETITCACSPSCTASLTVTVDEEASDHADDGLVWRIASACGWTQDAAGHWYAPLKEETE